MEILVLQFDHWRSENKELLALGRELSSLDIKEVYSPSIFSLVSYSYSFIPGHLLT